MKSKIDTRITVLRLLFAIGFLSFGIALVNSSSNKEIKNENEKPITEIKIENEIQNSESENDGRIEGDDIPASGYASLKSLEENTGVEIQIEPYWPLTEAERKTICYVVAGEAGGEPMEGKMAVAQCYLNAMVRSGTSVAETRIEYQYAGYDDKMQYSENEINKQAWAEVQEAVSRVFDNGERVTEEFIVWFYAPGKVTSKWHESQKYCETWGNHRFFAPWNIPENAKQYY